MTDDAKNVQIKAARNNKICAAGCH